MIERSSRLAVHRKVARDQQGFEPIPFPPFFFIHTGNTTSRVDVEFRDFSDSALIGLKHECTDMTMTF
jgi:hypothetical protein